MTSMPRHRFPRALRRVWIWCALFLAFAPAAAFAQDAAPSAAQDATPAAVPAIVLPDTDPLGVRAAQLAPAYWIAKLERPDQRMLDADAIAAQNARLHASDPTWNDLAALPSTLEREQILGWIQARSQRPQKTLYDEAGKRGNDRQIDRLIAALDLDAIPQTQVTRYGMIVRRASLRTFPTHLRVFTAPGDADIDRFQETALFPGTPVVIAQGSRDRKWWFVVSPLYTGWVEKSAVAEGGRDEVLAYAAREPSLLVTGATARTVHAPGNAALSELQLDMGVRVPRLDDVPPTATINGQLAYAAWPVQLPVRTEEGRLAFAPALLPRGADVAESPLPLTRANVLRQSFKFLGERYGWGHDYNGRDCSGFVSEIYRSMGVSMPRNTVDQRRSPAFDRVDLENATPQQRASALRALQVGDLLYVPGHVMMIVGRERGDPWVIHDVQGINVFDSNGALQRLTLNAVSVTPLLPLRADADTPLTDRILAIVRMRPAL